MADSLASCIQHWPIILRVCEKLRDEIDMNIANKVKHISIKRSADDFRNLRISLRMPISVALDRLQSDTCVVTETAQIWKNLQKIFE